MAIEVTWGPSFPTSILVWVVSVELMALAVLPLAIRLWRDFPGPAVALSKPVGLIVVGYVAWLLSMLGFLRFGQSATIAVALGVGLLCWWLWWGEAIAAARRSRPALAAFEAVFLLALSCATVIRAYNADIVGQEKFMDFALMNTFLAATDLPAEDPWLAGYGVPYYHLGYLILAMPAKLAGTAGPIAYNLAVAFVFAATFAGAAALVYALVRRDGDCSDVGLDGRALAYGVLGGMLVTIVGNLEGALELGAAGGFGDASFWRAVGVKGLVASPAEGIGTGGAWWWRASRVIPNIEPDGITEFPYFSFILGDLHPHYTALPLDLVVLALAMVVWTRGRAALGVPGLLTAALLLGVIVAANTWDAPVFWGVLCAAFAYDAVRRWRAGERRFDAVVRAALPFVLAPILISPYLFGYSSQQLGIGLVRERTPLASMAILFGPLLATAALFAAWAIARQSGRLPLSESRSAADRAIALLALAALVVLALRSEWTIAVLASLAALVVLGGVACIRGAVGERGDGRSVQFCWLLAAAGVAILLGVEIVFLRDLFGTRMNTVFKFHYNAWLLLGLVAAAGLGLMRSTTQGVGVAPAWRVAAGAALVLFVPGMVYPVAATWAKSGAFRGDPTLDGARFLARSRPGDADAIRWLRANAVGRPVVVEATGPDYQEFARVSTFSGLPTVVGWIGHEAQWRGERIDYGRRERDVEAMYRGESRDEIARLARPYRARYLFFGSLERDRYGDEAGQRLGRLLTPAYARGGTIVFNVPIDAGGGSQ